MTKNVDPPKKRTKLWPMALLVIAGGACLLAAVSGTSGGSTGRETVGSQPPSGDAPEGMVWVPAGDFMMGSPTAASSGHPDEGPLHEVRLDGFWMDETEVTNRQFKEFVDATGFVTTAEKPPVISGFKPGSEMADAQILPEFNKPGSICCREDIKAGEFNPEFGAYSWMTYVAGADWRHPEGTDSSIDDRMDHPVVHVSWDDAMAYCKWAKKTLPTEAQWEYAARGTLKGKTYPWGDDRNPGGKWMNNIWQGEFPAENTRADGFVTTAPVRSFPKNGFGLYEMSGNVWEWCSDLYHAEYYAESPRRNPTGPTQSYDPQEPQLIKRVQRGGSFACSDSYCIAYRMSARGKGEPSSGAFHQGFRCVRNVKKSAE